jgi:hypothetical protein
LVDINDHFEKYFKYGDSTSNAALAVVMRPAFKLWWIAREDIAVVDRLQK